MHWDDFGIPRGYTAMTVPYEKNGRWYVDCKPYASSFYITEDEYNAFTRKNMTVAKLIEVLQKLPPHNETNIGVVEVVQTSTTRYDAVQTTIPAQGTTKVTLK